MVDVYLGVEGLPISEEEKRRLRLLCNAMLMAARAREYLLVTHVFGPDPQAHDTSYRIRMALVLDGEDVRYAEGVYSEPRTAFALATRSLETQLQQELLIIHWHDHEDAVASE